MHTRTRTIWTMVLTLALAIGVVPLGSSPAAAEAPYLRALPWDGCRPEFPNCFLTGINRYEDELFQFRIEVEDGVTPVWSGDLPPAASIGGTPVGTATEVEGGLTFEWQPSEADGTLEPFPLNENLRGAYFNITISATNDLGETSSVDVYLRVEERLTPPVVEILNRSHAGTVPIGDAITFDVVGTDTDLPPATSISYGPVFGSEGPVEGASIDPVSGAFSWTTSPGQDGAYVLEILVTEQNPYDVTTFGVAEVPIAVGTGNRPPEIEILESALTIDPGGSAYVEFAGSDPDRPAQELTWSLEGAPPGAVLDFEFESYFLWSSTAADAGRTYEFALQLSDGIETTSLPLTIEVTGTPVDGPPSIEPIADVTIDELTRLFFEPVVSDPDGDPFDLVWEGTPPGAVINGIFDWTPGEDQGPDTYEVTLFAIQADDPDLFDSETFTITVDEVNEPPTLDLPVLPLEVSTDEPFTFDADATDPDLPANTLTFSLVGAPAGASIDPTTGEFSWTPTVDQVGPATFDVVVSDGVASDAAEVSVTVGEVLYADVGINRFELVDGDLDDAGAIRSPGPATFEIDYAANALFDDAPGTTLVVEFGVVPDFGIHNGAIFEAPDLPAGCSVDSDSSGFTTGFTCDLGTVEAGTGGTIPFTIEPYILLLEIGNYDVELELDARIESTLPDPFPMNNDSTITPELRARQADLAAAIGRPPTWTGDPAFLGEATSFVFYVDNLGPDLAANTVATVDWGPGVWEIASLPAACAAVTANSFTCDLGDVPADALVPTEFALTETGGDGVNHRITVTLTTDTIDPVTANDSATTQPVPVQRTSDVFVDLELFIGDDDGVVAPRDRLTYRATIYNGGPHDSLETNLGIEFVGHYGEVTVVDAGGCTPFDGSFPFQPQGLACPVGLLASPFGFSTFVFTVDVPLDETQLWVVAAEATTGSADPDTTNNRTSDGRTVDPTEADLLILPDFPVEPPSTVVAGGDATWTFAYPNGGPDTALAATLTIDVEGAVDSSATAGSGCTVEVVSDTLTRHTCDLGDVPFDLSWEYASVDVTAPEDGSVIVTATVAHPGTDPDAGNDEAVWGVRVLPDPTGSPTGPLDTTGPIDGKIDVDGSGFDPGTRVGGHLFSDPVFLGYLSADETGRVLGSFDLPDDTPDGPHRIVLTGFSPEGEPLVLSADICVGTCVEDTDGDGLTDDEEALTGTNPEVADTDGDGILDGIDPTWAFEATLALPDDVFRTRWAKVRLLLRLATAEFAVLVGRTDVAIDIIASISTRLDGCGDEPDRDDWVRECDAQLDLRVLIGLLGENLAET